MRQKEEIKEVDVWQNQKTLGAKNSYYMVPG
jgi:hypothetical protein